MQYATVLYTKNVGDGWDCATTRCHKPAAYCVRRSDAGARPARSMVYCATHAPIVRDYLLREVFPPGQRVLESYAANPAIQTPDSKSGRIPADYGVVIESKIAWSEGHVLVAHDGYEHAPDRHKFPETTGLWAVYEN